MMKNLSQNTMRYEIIVIIMFLVFVGCASKNSQVQAQKPEAVALSHIDYQTRLAELKKQITFSDTLLKEFPDLYEKLATLDAAGKFDLLQQITSLEEIKHTQYYKYKDQVTNSDIAGIIGEVLRDGGPGLTAYHKMAIIDIIRGKEYPSPIFSEMAPYGTNCESCRC